ncbi:hypothetical protein V8C37DRAFT_420743 [Trichoderma ceciliae]
MARCKLDALRIRQRKGRRRRQRGYAIQTDLQDHSYWEIDYDTTEVDWREAGDFETETIMLAERFNNEILGPETSITSEASMSSPISNKSKVSGEEDAAVDPDDWATQVRQAQEYTERYVRGTFLGPESRHSNVPSSSSLQICREIEERAQSISTSHETLHKILLRHESVIQARWAKKRPRQKQKILLELWPNMPKMHRPDFYAHRLAGYLDKDTEYRDWYMWPYINEHDLTTRDSLLLLLNSRGYSKPSDFVDADVAAMRYGLEIKVLKSNYLSGYAIILSDAKSSEDYGKLVDISAYSEMELLDLDKDQISPYYGILILEAQERLLAFLVNCCKQILHDIPSENLVSGAFPILPEAPKPVSDVDKFNLAVVAAEAPYRVPAKPNFKLIGLMLGAKASETKDHLVNLREDPAYFVNAMMAIKEHSSGNALFPGENEAAFYSSDHGQLILSQDLAFVVGRAYTDFECFTDLHQQVQELELLHAKYETDILPTKDMPDEILLAMLKFQTCVWQVAKIRRLALVRVVQNSPAWRRYFDCSGGLSTFQADKSNVKVTAVRRHLIWLLQCITHFDPNFPSLANAIYVCLPLFMDEIETLRENEAEAWELTSSLIGEIIDELAMLSQCMEQVDLYLRRIRDYGHSIAERQYDGEIKWAKKMEHIYFLTKPGEAIYNSFAELADYGNKRFFYPWDRRRNRENVEAMQKAESNLDHFWAAADQNCFQKIKGFRESFIGQQIQSLRNTLRRTPDWVEESEPTTKQARLTNANHGEFEIYKPPFTLCSDQSDITGSLKQVSRLHSRSKVKTKGQPHKAVTEPNVNTIEELIPSRLSLIPVDARALKVFRVLFYNPEITSSPGEIPWKDFIHAMVCTGFSAQKLQGSMWQFSKTNDDGQQTILFHEPHPHKKLPFFVARSIGWRLNRHFQWSLEIFDLKLKEVEA